MLEKQLMEMVYARATTPEDLVWHREQPAAQLVEAVAQRPNRGKALDLGCGAGVHSVYLAKKGFAVTGLDFIPKALALAQQRAAPEGIQIKWVHADLLQWQTADTFDLVLDSGCLHNISRNAMAKYRSQLLRWLRPGGDFVLSHFGKRNALDWRPVGPRRRTRAELVRFFAPALDLQSYHSELMHDIPFPVGPSVLGQSFRFRRRHEADGQKTQLP